MKQEILRLERVTREIKGDIYLDNINMHIFKGEIIGFIASEAKGKKELIELLYQNLPIAYGQIYYNGKKVNSYAHSDMTYNKVYIIEQKSRLIEDLSVGDNIFVMRRGFKKYLINKKVLGTQVGYLMDEFGIRINPSQVITRLSDLDRCIVELIRAKLMGCQLIVLNDLNNFLNQEDLCKFQKIIVQFCEKGFSFLYVGNHHEDVYKICSRSILFANSRIIKVFEKDEMDDEHIAPYIVSFGLSSKKMRKPSEERLLEFKQVTSEHLDHFSLTVKRGECLAILDTDNSVISDMISLMTSGAVPISGTIIMNGNPYTLAMSQRALLNGVAMIEDNPLKTMVFTDMSYISNLMFLLDLKLGKSLLHKKYIHSVIKEYSPLIGEAIYSKDVRELDPKSLYDMVYYRIHLYGPDIVFCIHPFSFGDMYSRNHILELIRDLKNKGIAVVMLLVNLSDSLNVADRLLISQKGNIDKEFTRDEFENI